MALKSWRVRLMRRVSELRRLSVKPFALAKIVAELVGISGFEGKVKFVLQGGAKFFGKGNDVVAFAEVGGGKEGGDLLE